MNKNQTWRKVLSLLCAMVMLVGIMVVGSVVASAAETEYVAYIGEQGYTSLASAVAACTESGDYLITMSKSDNTSFTFKKLDGVNITIDGKGNTYGGTITFTADASYDDQVTVFKNVVFKTTNKKCIGISSQYVCNVTFDACSFTGSASYSFDFGGSQYPHNFKFTNNCVVNMGNGLWQSTCAVSNLVVEDMHIIKVGTAFKFNYGSNAASSTATFSNVTVDYANIFFYLMSDANIEGIEVTNCDINANYPVLRQDKGAYNYHLTFRGNNNITLNGNNSYNLSTLEGYDYVFVNGALNSNANFTMTTVPYYGIIDGTLYEDATAFADALKALKNHKHEDHAHKIVLGKDCDVDFDIGEHRDNGGELGAHVVLDLNGHNYTGEITLHNMSELTVEGLADGTTINVVECDPALTRVHHNEINHWIASRHNISYVTTPPTCVEDGYTTYTCENCDYTYTVKGESATGIHNFQFVETVAPTTAAGGYDLYDCADCDATDKRNLTDPITAVASVNGVVYETIQAAINAAPANATVYILADVSESVTIKKNITLDGQNNQYTGTITVNAGYTITIQNVKFVNGGIDKPKAQKSTTGVYHIYDCTFDGEGVYAYSLRFYGANTIDVQRCTVENYLYSFLYVPSSAINVDVYDVTVDGGNSYGVYFASGVTNATFENFTVKNNPKGILINNTADRSFTIKNCKMVNVGTAIAHSSGTNAIACTISGNENDFGGAALSQYANVIFADAATTLVANAGFEFATSVANSCVYFANGVYSVKAHTYKDTVTPPTTESQGFTTHTCENCGDYYVDSYVPVLSYVAQVGTQKYATLQAAIDAANGQTVYLIDDVNENVTIKANITLDGQNNKYTGTMTVNKGLTITIQNVKFVNGGIDKPKAQKSNTGVYHIYDCTFDGEGVYSYPLRFQGANTIDVQRCTVENYLYSFLYVTSSTTNVYVYDVTVDGGNSYGVYFASGVTNATFENFTVKNNPRGFLINNTADRSFTIKNCKMENVGTAIAHSNGTNAIACTILGNENDFGGAAISQYANVIFADAATTLVANQGLEPTTNVAGSCVYYADGVYSVKAHTYKDTVTPPTTESQGFTTHECENCGHSYVDSYVDPLSYVAEVNGEKFETLQAAINAANGQTVYLIDDVTENVTIKYSITLDGQNNQYTGTMTVNAGLTITIQNVNFVNGGILKSAGSTTGKYTITNCTFDGANNTYAYAFSIKGANTVIIENCSVKDYMYGFLYVRSGVVNVTVKNVSVENCPNYAVYFASGVNNASFEKFTVKNANRGFLINNTTNRTLTVKDCVMEDVNTAVADSNGTLTITCKLLGENNFGGAALSQYASVLLGATDAKLVAPETANVGVVAGLAAEYRAVFAEDTWFVKAIDFVAQVGTQKYESLQAAIDAAADGATVILLKDVAYTDADFITTSNNLTTIIKVEGKSITLDMNGKKISLVYENTTTTVYSVVYVGNGAGLTVIDGIGDGAIDVRTHETSPKVAYMFLKDGAAGYLKIESGYFHMNNSEDSMFYTNADRVIFVSGGTFVLDKAGTRANGFPCIFNTKGQNERKIVVTGGSFNVDVNHQYYCFEVEIDKTLALAYDAATGLWTVVDAVAYIGEIEGVYTHNVGYATIEEANARADELGDGFSTFVILTDDTLKSANLFVGSYINVYFNVYQSSFSSAFTYTAYVYDANNKEVAKIPSNLWETHEGSEDLYKINFKNLAAKQMADEFKLVIVCDDERVLLSDNTVESFSVKSYVEKGWNSFTPEQKQLLSAMLAYGAAAQDAFKYDSPTGEKATDVDVTNGLLTVTPVPENLQVDNSLAMRSYYYGASVTLENTIYFNFKFFADSVEGAAYAVIEAGGKQIRVEAANFRTETKKGKEIVVVTFDASVANATELAKCTFYTAENTEIVTAQDNILSYCYRAIAGINATPGYTSSFGVEFYTALAEYAYAVSTYSTKENN